MLILYELHLCVDFDEIFPVTFDIQECCSKLLKIINKHFGNAYQRVELRLGDFSLGYALYNSKFPIGPQNGPTQNVYEKKLFCLNTKNLLFKRLKRVKMTKYSADYANGPILWKAILKKNFNSTFFGNYLRFFAQKKSFFVNGELAI